ncbi:2-dehydropantoate 2-reductase [Piscinibacter defluvii]|uniref:2-dehydropantoate 2-reductase n=1 Tax=Piscinibacter defluvii TaxID=1796922 RepID=UPI000FDEE415|nr:2-dehydropantoate 2-reductase [Piscinibacter defluvii]
MMDKVCIVGAGAIGGFLGARLALQGAARVSALARGATLAALQQQGWRLREAGQLHTAPAQASDDPAALGPQDLVIVAVKAPALASVAPRLAPLLGPQTLVLTAMNGVPWWFGQGVAALGAAPLAHVDPDGAIAAALPFERVLGGVVHLAATTTEPGLVEHRMGRALIVGEPRGGSSERAERVGALLRAAGLEVTVSPAIRSDIWYKLWGNLTINPVSAITGATADRLLDDALVRDFCSRAMREAAQIGERLGCPIAQGPEDRHAVTRKLGAFRSSMLQDVEAGRPLELDAIVGVVHELGRRLDVPTPNIDALFGLTRLFGRVHGLYPG